VCHESGSPASEVLWLHHRSTEGWTMSTSVVGRGSPSRLQADLLSSMPVAIGLGREHHRAEWRVRASGRSSSQTPGPGQLPVLQAPTRSVARVC